MHRWSSDSGFTIRCGPAFGTRLPVRTQKFRRCLHMRMTRFVLVTASLVAAGCASEATTSPLADPLAEHTVVLVPPQRARARASEHDHVWAGRAYVASGWDRVLVEHQVLALGGRALHVHPPGVQRDVRRQVPVEVHLHHGVGRRDQEAQPPARGRLSRHSASTTGVPGRSSRSAGLSRIIR